jgi:acyl carrier protein
MNTEIVASLVLREFRDREALRDLKGEDNIFDYGVSSLTVVQVQAAIESVLQIELPTKILMKYPTANEWSKRYSSALLAK